MPSIIDSHPQKQAIIDGLFAGRSLRDIANSVTPRVSLMAVQRYRLSKVTPALKNASMLTKVLHAEGLVDNFDGVTETGTEVLAVTKAALSAEPILSRIQQHQRTADRFISEADSGRDAAALINADLKGLELTARLSGLLDGPQQSAGTVNNFYIAVAAPPVPAAGPVIDVEPSK